MLQIVNKDGLVCQKRDEPYDLADSHLEVLGLHQLVAQVLQTAVASGDLLGSLCGQKQRIVIAADANYSSSLVIHVLFLLRCSVRIGRLVHFLIPVGDGVGSHSGIALGNLCLPGMLAIAVHLVAAEDGALNGRGAEGDAVTLGGKVRSRDAELHTVQPVIFIFAVGLLGTEAHSHRIAAILGCRHYDTICINGRTSKVGCGGSTDFIHTQGQGAILELLDDFGSTVIGIEGSLCQFHGEVGSHCLRHLNRGRIGLVTFFILGDLGVIQFIKTDSSHDLFLHFIVFGHIHSVVVVASFRFITDVSAVGYGEFVCQERFYNGILICDVVALSIKGQSGLLHINARGVICMEVEGVCDGDHHDVFRRGGITEHTSLYGNIQAGKHRLDFCKYTHNFPTSSSNFCCIAAIHADLDADFAGFKKGFAG
nr:MAG TPA: hypothetical protein [Caudoviricetes sp.]